MSAKAVQKPNSEDLFGKTVDRCVTDTIVKAGKYGVYYVTLHKQWIGPEQFAVTHTHMSRV